MENTNQKTPEKKEKKASSSIVRTSKKKVPTRGRIFEGIVTKKFPHRVVVELERTVFVRKYERFSKKRIRIHARIQEDQNINLGDLIKVQQCRPLSKIIHFIVMGITKKAISSTNKSEEESK